MAGMHQFFHFGLFLFSGCNETQPRDFCASSPLFYSFYYAISRQIARDPTLGLAILRLPYTSLFCPFFGVFI